MKVTKNVWRSGLCDLGVVARVWPGSNSLLWVWRSNVSGSVDSQGLADGVPVREQRDGG